MAADFSSSFGKLSILKQNRHITAILEFIETYIEKFIFIYWDEYSNIHNETGITQELCSYFQSKINEHPFYFHHEDRTNLESGQSPSVDFSVKTRVPFGKFRSRQTIFSIEAKRLPTPGSGRGKEYVYSPMGKYGGIERFKKEIHGKGLSHSAMIAYMQRNNFHYWFEEVNRWIYSLIKIKSCEIKWHKEDLLVAEYYREKIAKFTSMNKRENNYISLTHFWIDLRSRGEMIKDRIKSNQKS